MPTLGSLPKKAQPRHQQKTTKHQNALGGWLKKPNHGEFGGRGKRKRQPVQKSQ